MTDLDSQENSILSATEAASNIGDLPEQLAGVAKRQAVHSIAGTVYQAWWSIDAWLRLASADEVIYLEGAEDFDLIKEEEAIAVQVKHNVGSISLNTVKAHEALENYWLLHNKEVNRHVSFHYITTSSVAMERDADFDGMKGFEAWRIAQTSSDMAGRLAGYLVTKLDDSSDLRAFLKTETLEGIQKQLFQKFHWLTEQPSIEAVKRSVDERIAVFLNSQRRSISLVPSVRKYLESRFWDLIVETSPENRCLTFGELLQQIESATTTYLPLPTDKIPDLIANAHPGLGLFKLLLDKAPRPPSPLLQRPELTQYLERLVNLRKIILLTGTVHKGKTTIAQLVATSICPDAWFINLTGRQHNEIDNILLALAGEIESGGCPELIILDDIDLDEVVYQTYRDSLALVIHRAASFGRGLILTAKGGASNASIIRDISKIKVLDIPEMDSDEIVSLCGVYGCPEDIVANWGAIIAASTGGHPKLVQVNIAELQSQHWPRPGVDDLTGQSSGVLSVRQLARRLLSGSVSETIATYVYTVSESNILLHRSIAIKLAESLEGVLNAGDVIDQLTGRWLECVEGDWFRVTALLKGAASDVWSLERKKIAHIALYDVIRSKNPLDPYEAAALVYHGYVSGDSGRLIHAALKLQFLDNEEAEKEIQKNLLWLPLIALQPGEYIVDDAVGATVIRMFQYRVATTLDSDYLSDICARWADDIERIDHEEVKAANQAMMWLSVGTAENPKVPLKPRLDALLGMPKVPVGIIDADLNLGKNFFDIANPLDGVPEDGSTEQAILLMAIRCVRDLESLDELIQWLDTNATNEIRRQFDDMLGWPLVQNLGAYFQGAWTADHEQIEDWGRWLEMYERIDEYAVRRGSLQVGQESAKARSIILSEYVGQADLAVTVISQAEEKFGTSVVLTEQRANLLFQSKDDQSVLEIWREIEKDPDRQSFLDPYAKRRVGISAARLELWDESAQIFIDAAETIREGELEQTKLGLLIDAAYVTSLSGEHARATSLLVDVIQALPDEAAVEGNGWWEAIQRTAVAVCRDIDNRIWQPEDVEPKFDPGYASSPSLNDIEPQQGQAARTELTKAQVLHLASTVFSVPGDIIQEIEVMLDSRYYFVRWHAAEACLAVTYANGAGNGFIGTLLSYDKAVEVLSARAQQGRSLLDTDDGAESSIPENPDRWFGMLCAGVICSGENLLAHLQIWCDESAQILGEDVVLTRNIQQLLEGASLPIEDLYSAILDMSNSSCLRFGAASRLLQENVDPAFTLQLQGLLASGLVSDASTDRQALFNIHVARHFASKWYQHAQNRFQFITPNRTIPRLIDSLDGLESGSSTLKSVLVAASNALGLTLDNSIVRVH